MAPDIPSERDVAAFWAGLQARAGATLGRAVPAGSRVAFLDVPIYPNIGDLLIFLGTVTWLRGQRCRVIGQWPRQYFPFPDLPPDALILCQGGGNFGDLYPFQAFRERVVARYPGHRVVFLPQTVHYRDDQGLRAAAAVLGRHPDLHMFFRDAVSLEAVRRELPDAAAEMAPDMATFLFPLSRTLGLAAPGARRGRLALLRHDGETLSGQDDFRAAADWVGDWDDVIGRRVNLIWFFDYLYRKAGPVVHRVGAAPGWHMAAAHLCRFCAGRLAAAQSVVTSRLHGHILASLLGVPNDVLDNSYGKNSAYHAAWHGDLEIARVLDRAPPPPTA